MMNEEYIQFETAKLLKEAGFPQNPKRPHYNYNPHVIDDWHTEYDWCQKSTQAQAMRWLREKHSISVELSVSLDEKWCLDVWEYRNADLIRSNDDGIRYDTYEAAAEAGIKAACKYLIGQK